MRERLKLSTYWQVGTRITPARAGKTVKPGQQLTLDEDHPRSCGKDNCVRYVPHGERGSPPLVRERHAMCEATTGKFVDHPRSCGKDSCKSPLYSKNLGSPPLVRERLRCFRRYIMSVGITPARAGKTSLRRYPLLPSWDHPRSCGKDSKTLYTLAPSTGSPPLVRERLIT